MASAEPLIKEGQFPHIAKLEKVVKLKMEDKIDGRKKNYI